MIATEAHVLILHRTTQYVPFVAVARSVIRTVKMSDYAQSYSNCLQRAYAILSKSNTNVSSTKLSMLAKAQRARPTNQRDPQCYII